MQFFKAFLRNLGILIVIGIVLFVLYPATMRQMFELYGALFGPGAVLVLIGVALPRRRRS